MKHDVPDAVTVGHVWTRVQAAADEMEATLAREAFSGALAEEGDFAAIVCGSDGETWTQSSCSNPFQAALLSLWVSTWRDWEETSEAGTVWVSNDPYLGGSSLCDLRLATAIFSRGVRVGVLACAGHVGDVGGRTAGGVSPGATDVQQEGVRICPTILARDWTMDTGILDILSGNSRFPDELKGDLQALVDGLRAGARRATSLYERYDRSLVSACETEVRDHTREATRNALAEIETGVYTCQDRLDGDGVVTGPMHLRTQVNVTRENIEIDLSGTSESATGPMNAPADAIRAASLVAFRHIFPELPTHGAVSGYLDVSISEDSFLNARFPQPVSGSSAEVVPRVVAACVEAFSQGVHGRAMGSGGGATHLILEGRRNGVTYRMCLTLGSGGGASGKGDGLNNGDGSTRFIRFQDLEGIERRFPLRVIKYGLRPGSGGSGRYAGGCGCDIVFELLKGPAFLTVFGDRHSRGPGGTHRGTRGHTAEIEIFRDGHWQQLPHRTKVESLELLGGDQVGVATAGGGGYGHPFERAIRLVSRDVRSGHLSCRDAAMRHGVLFETEDARDYDSAKTFKLRSYRLTAADVEGILDEIEKLDDATRQKSEHNNG